jgi:hypothetical protein
MSRALRQYAKVEENGITTLIPQITYYQKGVGTGVVDRYIGGKLSVPRAGLLVDKIGCAGLSGAGLSANVRAAYAFLAENYHEGDQLYFFGFSRGAYTARAVAGLVADMGLLTNRGLDNFSTVYNDYYKYKTLNYDEETRRRLGFRPPLPRFTIQIIGVFDTVGFHDFHITSKLFGEKFELPNTILSREVRYAFHALSLDETRKAFAPTLWHCPTKVDDQELLQVWFSGGHGDVGGGDTDPRLSNIALAWMISHCTKHAQLEFHLDYLFDKPPPPLEPLSTPWATSRGRNEMWTWMQYMQSFVLGSSKRTPLRYTDGNDNVGYTNEKIHESINDRNIYRASDALTGFVFWPSKVVTRKMNDSTWLLKNGLQITEVQASATERALKGRIRTVHALQIDPA